MIEKIYAKDLNTEKDPRQEKSIMTYLLTSKMK